MKKMVVFSLLVLSFPLVAFADTSDSVLDVPTASSQEQVVDSASVTNEAIAEKPVADSSKTQPSEEGTVESKKTSNEEVSAADKTMKEDPTAKTATNEFAEVEKTTNSNTVEKNASTVAPQQTTGEAAKSPATLEEKIINEWTAEDIRKNLTSADFGMNQTELKGYTDQELTNAFKLFARYNFDITGMDFGSYVQVLRMVYKDQVISWADAEKALAFNPNNYTTTAELANNVDQLQAYLRILYSSKEGFLPLRHFTNEEMLHILNHLSGAEDELSAANGLFSGLVHWLYNSQEGNGPIENGSRPVPPIQNTATATKPIVENLATVPTDQKNLSAQVTGQKEYPKTGENRNLVLTFTGITLFIIAGVMILRRRVRL